MRIIPIQLERVVRGVCAANPGITRADLDEYMRDIMSGRSPCCKAEIDQSEVAGHGKKAGDGPRFCKQCRRKVFEI